MRIVEVTKNFNRGGVNFAAGHSYVMAEDIEQQHRNLNGDCLGMSHPFENTFRKYNSEDLTGKRILVFRTGGIGDIFFLSCVFPYLKRKYPTCFIRFASACKQPVENAPWVDELYDMPFDAKLLEDIDYVAFFQGIIESSNDKSKVTHAADMFYSYFGIDSLQFPDEDKRPRIFINDAEQKWVKEECSKLGIQSDDMVIGIQMETSAPLRNYPKEKMKVIIDVLAKEDKVKICLIGSPQQQMLGNFFRGNYPNVFVFTNYDVRKAIILTSRYNIVISPDSFMVQAAGALDKPLIGLYGPFPSEVRMKYFKNAIGLDTKVVCAPCFKHDFRPCIKGFPSPCFSVVDPEDVLQAIDYQRNKFYGGHFNYIAPLFQAPDFKDIEQYFLSADKGLCFFGANYTHPNMVKVDINKFFKADINDLNHPFEHGKYPFVLFINNFGYQNGNVYNNCKNFVRPGGYFIVHRDDCVDGMFAEIQRDVGKNFTILYSKFDPVSKKGTLVGRRPF